jgi:predicted transcriptional regulator
VYISKEINIMKRRPEHMIILEMLDVCVKGSSKTRIVYRANLNFKTITPYLDLLIANGFLNVRKERLLIYETTPKGLTLLDYLKQLQNMLIPTSAQEALMYSTWVPEEI